MKHPAYWILRNKSIRLICQFFSMFAAFPLFCLGYLIPRDPTVWVFANTFGFKDNAAYLFEHIQKNNPEITPVWISRNKPVRSSFKTGLSYHRFSITGLWLQYHAGISFASTGLSDFARFTLAGSNVVQLWHGIPIKRILLDSPETVPFANSIPIAHAFLTRILRRNLQRYSLVLASSHGVQQRLSTAFGLPKTMIPVTGYPRHDIIILNSKNVKKRILYAPTWRDDIQTAFKITREVCNRNFISALHELGYELWVSIHPLNGALKKRFSSITDVVHFVDDHDINITLAESEILITDYSSIAIDFSLLKRKILFFTPDIDSYLRSRGLYKEFTNIIQQQGISKGNELLTAISSNNCPPAFSFEPFFRYRDTDARARIVATVQNLLTTRNPLE